MRRVRRIAVTMASILALTAPAANAQMLIGLSDPSQEYTLTYWQTLVTMHAKVVRLWVDWPQLVSAAPRHPANPNDPAYNWATLDQRMGYAQQAGWRGVTLVTILQTPRWAHRYPHQRGVTAAPKPAAYAAFATALAKRYNGSFTPSGALSPLPAIQGIEVWNEPNMTDFWQPSPADHRHKNWAGEYVDVLNATYTALHALPRPHPFVLGGAIGGFAGMTHLAFLNTMIRDHARLDGITLHPYPSDDFRGVYDGTKPSSGWLTTGDFGFAVQQIQRWRGKRFPIWISEISWQANPPNSTFGVSWPAQNLYMKQSAALFRRYPQVAAFLWYQFKDSTVFWQSGLETASGQHRPIWNTFMRLTGALPSF
jgi:hypothetical protein